MPRSKKDIDKEKMYKKLLPTAAAAEAAAERKEPEKELLVEEATAPGAADLPFAEEKGLPGEPDAAAKSDAPPRKNLMEPFVEARIDEAMARFNCCRCDKCRSEIMKRTLEKLEPYYEVESDRNLRDEREKQRAAAVAPALVQAILAVKTNPGH